MIRSIRSHLLVGALIVMACGPVDRDPTEQFPPDLVAFVGATLHDGLGGEPQVGTLIVSDGRIADVGPNVEIPDDARVIDVEGRHITPGLINAHGHVGATIGLQGGHYSRENILRLLGLYASYGVTTVVSLGGDGPEGVEVREEQALPGPGRSRLYVAGNIVVGSTADEVRAEIAANAEMGVDFIKIRVDDQLGTTTKMSREIYGEVITAAHEHEIPVAAHLFYLEDAHGLLDAGVDFIVHSVRDQDVDTRLAERLIESGVCYSPTLTREVSTFVYESEPDFFDDPFFLASADPGVLGQLLDPASMERYQNSRSGQLYKEALVQAQRNLGTLSDAGVTIAMGTDTGPPGRFQGYFEHMELELMAASGMSPSEILVASTGAAARCAGLDDIGTLETGKWADLLVLRDDPTTAVTNFRSIESVWIGGDRVPAVSQN